MADPTRDTPVDLEDEEVLIEEEPRPGRGAWRGPQGEQAATPDVVLDVPELTVEKLNLEVEQLRARVDVHAEITGLLQLGVGADVETGRVALDLEGVRAQAHLTVRLDQVAAIVSRALETLDRNPELLTTAARGLREGLTPRRLGQGGGLRGVGGQLGGALGDTLDRVGGVIETGWRRISRLGRRSRPGEGPSSAGPGAEVHEVSSHTDLAVVQEVYREDGRTLRRIIEPSGQIIEVTLGDDGEVLEVTARP